MNQKLKIMVVDDEAIVGKRLKPSLESSGYTVETFGDGRSAIARLSKERFDIVITDVRMDDVDGMQILEYVRANIPQTKVIIITGYASVDLARRALDKGAFDFIAKPFKPGDLRTVIEKAARAPSA